jgi:hypothetical protein
MPALDTDFERRNRYLYSPNWMKELPPSSENSGARKLDGGHDLTEGVAGVPGVVIQEIESQPSVRPGWGGAALGAGSVATAFACPSKQLEPMGGAVRCDSDAHQRGRHLAFECGSSRRSSLVRGLVA